MSIALIFAIVGWSLAFGLAIAIWLIMHSAKSKTENLKKERDYHVEELKKRSKVEND